MKVGYGISKICKYIFLFCVIIITINTLYENTAVFIFDGTQCNYITPLYYSSYPNITKFYKYNPFSISYSENICLDIYNSKYALWICELHNNNKTKLITYYNEELYNLTKKNCEIILM